MVSLDQLRNQRPTWSAAASGSFTGSGLNPDVYTGPEVGSDCERCGLFDWQCGDNEAISTDARATTSFVPLSRKPNRTLNSPCHPSQAHCAPTSRCLSLSV